MDEQQIKIPVELEERVRCLEAELAAAAQAFAIHQKAIVLLVGHVTRQAEALRAMGLVIENLAVLPADAVRSLRTAEEIAELKKMFEQN